MFSNRRLAGFVKAVTCIYIALPFFIFAVGWLKWYISCPVIILVAFAVWRYFSKSEDCIIDGLNKRYIGLALVIVAVTFAWVYLSGVGGFVYQNPDHGWRNAIFRVLVNNDWPVQMKMEDGSTHALIYYIGFWLPASVIGKLFGMQAGFYFQALWAVLGILLVFYYLFYIRQKVSLWIPVIFIFFSGLDILGGILTGENLSMFQHIEWWANPYQYSSMTTQLFWVFNQAIPAWLIIILLYIQKNNRSMALIIAFAMLASTIPFVGMIPFTIYFVIRNIRSDRNKMLGWRYHLKDILTYENIVGGGLVGIISFLYLIGNISGQNIQSANHAINSSDHDATLMVYLLFIFFEVGLYLILLFKYQKANALYFVIVGCLALCPLIRIGFGSDFCMRASIPALTLLIILVLDTLHRSFQKKDYCRVALLCIVLLIGAVTPGYEIGRTINRTVAYQRDDKNIWCAEPDMNQFFTSENFTGISDDKFFFKYLTK